MCCSRAAAFDSGDVQTAGCAKLAPHKLSEFMTQSWKVLLQMGRQVLQHSATSVMLNSGRWAGSHKRGLPPLGHGLASSQSTASRDAPHHSEQGCSSSRQALTVPLLEKSSESKSKILLAGTARETAFSCAPPPGVWLVPLKEINLSSSFQPMGSLPRRVLP